jgi:hypothetical protein
MACHMDAKKKPPIVDDRILDLVEDPETSLALLDEIFDQIEDPEVGLALLTKLPTETPERSLNRLFWQIQFTNLRDWLAGDVLAVGRALTTCMLGKKRPSPTWLCRAVNELCVQHMSPSDKNDYTNMMEHFMRWEAAERAHRQLLKDPRNRKMKVHNKTVLAEAVKMLVGTKAECGEETVKKSHLLIKRAGGSQVTLENYKRAVEKRDRGRSRKKI